MDLDVDQENQKDAMEIRRTRLNRGKVYIPPIRNKDVL